MQNDDERRRRADQDYRRRQQARQSEQNRGYGDDRYQEGRSPGDRERGRDLYAEGYGEQRYDNPSWREWQPSESDDWRGRSARAEGDRADPSRYSRGERYGSDERRSEQRYSPDWSRRESEPFESGDPYYSRNRRFNEPEGARGEYRSRGAGERWDESRGSSGEGGAAIRGSESGRDQGREGERAAENERYYRGYYGRSWTPYSYPGGRGDLYVESWVLTGPHTGRGPKGYKRSDQQIVEDACQRLERDGRIDASDIEVTAEDGVIKLTGTVADRDTKRRAEECVESVYGAHDVMNQLRVQREGAERGSTSESSAQSTATKQTRGGSASRAAAATAGDDGGAARAAAADQEKRGSKSNATKEQHN